MDYGVQDINLTICHRNRQRGNCFQGDYDAHRFIRNTRVNSNQLPSYFAALEQNRHTLASPLQSISRLFRRGAWYFIILAGRRW